LRLKEKRKKILASLLLTFGSVATGTAVLDSDNKIKTAEAASSVSSVAGKKYHLKGNVIRLI